MTGPGISNLCARKEEDQLLVVKVYVGGGIYVNSPNEVLEQIDEVWIHNTGRIIELLHGENAGLSEYKIVKPEGFTSEIIYHNRDDGYIPLLIQTLGIINEPLIREELMERKENYNA